METPSSWISWLDGRENSISPKSGFWTPGESSKTQSSSSSMIEFSASRRLDLPVLDEERDNLSLWDFHSEPEKWIVSLLTNKEQYYVYKAFADISEGIPIFSKHQLPFDLIF